MSTLVKKIYKFPLTNMPIEMPAASKVLAFDFQKGEPYIWVDINHGSTQFERRTFAIFPTGVTEVPAANYVHVSTKVTNSGYVWHLYEVVS